MLPYEEGLIPLVICGFVIAFILAFGIGANDVANSFGTSVGAKVLTLTQACILGSIFEILGSILIGYKVSDTIRKGILDVTLYENGGERLLAAGCLASLAASALWLILATALGLPVSGTHSVVGATIGFTLTAKGAAGIRWNTLGAIVASWFISPITSGAVSSGLYYLVRYFILESRNPLKEGLLALPFIYGATVTVNFLSVILDGPKLLKMDNLPFWVALGSSLASGILVALLVRFLLVPYYRRVLQPQPASFTLGMSNETTPAVTPTSPNKSPMQRSTSPLSEENKALGVIPESGEMVTLSDTDKDSLGVREMNAKNRAILATMDDCSIFSRSLSPPDKSRLQLLDPDPQIDTLKYIDETMSCCKSMDSSYLAGMVGSYDMENGFLADSTDTITQLDRFAATKVATVVDFDSPIFLCDKDYTRDNGHRRKKAHGKTEHKTGVGVTPNSSAAPLLRAVSPPAAKPPKQPPPPEALKLFSFLQALTAVFGSFAHGGNDVSNAIGPLVALWLIYTEGAAHAKAETPLAILFYGGVGIAVGLWVWGRRVIKTIGEDLTTITPDTGFVIEIGAAMTVLVASKVGLPISTTHCKVGSVVFVGYASKKPVDWSLFRNIIYVWLVTVPAVGALAAMAMIALTAFVV